MVLFNRDAKERFEEEMKANSPVAADVIQASVAEAGKSTSLGPLVERKENFALSKAGKNLYGASQGALNKQAELKAEREAKQQIQQRASINGVLFAVMKATGYFRHCYLSNSRRKNKKG